MQQSAICSAINVTYANILLNHSVIISYNTLFTLIIQIFPYSCMTMAFKLKDHHLLTKPFIKGHSLSKFYTKKYLQSDIFDIMDIFVLYFVIFLMVYCSKVQDMY